MNDRIPTAKIKQTIIYLCILSYTQPGRVAEMGSAADVLKGEIGDDLWRRALLQACKLIVAFQQASRDPDMALVERLADAALSADSSPEACRAFQEQMQALAQLPGRAKESNRLHRKKGCRFCEVPCRYGYFTLISEPNFEELQQALEAENRKPSGERQPIQAVWKYTLEHLSGALDAGQWHVPVDHVGNLAYCLLMLSTTKSRFAFPEEVVKRFQEQNQQWIEHYR